MSEIPKDLLYTEDHEYVKPAGESGVVYIGITDFAQGELRRVYEVGLALCQPHLSRLVSVIDRYSGETQQAQHERQPELLNKRRFHRIRNLCAGGGHQAKSPNGQL